MPITVYFDYVCPWCWIGHRHLTEAMRRCREMQPALTPTAVWEGICLLPDIPPGGVPYQAFYEQRLGGQNAVAARRRQVAESGRAAGLEFCFERIQTMPNTTLAHALTRYARHGGTPEQADALVERLFAGFFVDGLDIGDPDTLCAIAAAVGLDARRAANALAAAPLSTPYAAPLAGVPCFVFAGGRSIAGAHPPETLLALMLGAGSDQNPFQGPAP